MSWFFYFSWTCTIRGCQKAFCQFLKLKHSLRNNDPFDKWNQRIWLCTFWSAWRLFFLMVSRCCLLSVLNVFPPRPTSLEAPTTKGKLHAAFQLLQLYSRSVGYGWVFVSCNLTWQIRILALESIHSARNSGLSWLSANSGVNPCCWCSCQHRWRMPTMIACKCFRNAIWHWVLHSIKSANSWRIFHMCCNHEQPWSKMFCASIAAKKLWVLRTKRPQNHLGLHCCSVCANWCGPLERTHTHGDCFGLPAIAWSQASLIDFEFLLSIAPPPKPNLNQTRRLPLRYT